MLLTPDQIVELTGYRQPRKQVAALRRMGIHHFVRPLDGRPVVDDSALSPTRAEPAAEPDWSRVNER